MNKVNRATHELRQCPRIDGQQRCKHCDAMGSADGRAAQRGGGTDHSAGSDGVRFAWA